MGKVLKKIGKLTVNYEGCLEKEGREVKSFVTVLHGLCAGIASAWGGRERQRKDSVN